MDAIWVDGGSGGESGDEPGALSEEIEGSGDGFEGFDEVVDGSA